MDLTLLEKRLATLTDAELLALSPIKPADLEAEAQEKAEASLYEYTRQAWTQIESQPLIDNWHIGLICEHLQATTEGQIENLLINIPPGCSKSLMACVFWMTWEWTKNATIRWFFASYDQRLSSRDSVKCRALMRTPWYRARWGDKFLLTSDQNQKTYYENNVGGYRMATSCGGHGTGEHPDRIVVDDPHNVKKAESEKERQAVTDWWDLTMSTRGLSRKPRRVIVMQRLHESDLSGHVLERGGYEHICLPMRYEPGRMKTTSIGGFDPRENEDDLLSPSQFDEPTTKKLEGVLGPYGTAGQLQQRPTAREGGMFKRLWFETVPIAPSCDHYVRAWDKAATEGGGDYTAGVLLGRKGDEIYILDVVRGQWASGKRDDNIELIAIDDDGRHGNKVKVWFEQEPGSGGKQSAEISKGRLSRLGLRVDFQVSTGTKEARADSFASAAALKNVKLVQGTWNKAFLDELIVFPNAAHDDQVDAASMAFNKLCAPKRRLLVAQ